MRISFCPESRSGELPPATFVALYKQRLRWALGWDQVTIQHTRHIWTNTYFTCAQKFGFYWLLPLRWALLFSATLNALVTPLVTAFFHVYDPKADLGGPINTALALSFYGYLINTIVTLINCVVHEPPQMWPAILAFMASGSLYIGWQLMLVVVSLSKIFLKADGGWEVTTRMLTSTEGQTPPTANQPPDRGASPAPAALKSPPFSPTMSPLNAAFHPIPSVASRTNVEDAAPDLGTAWSFSALLGGGGGATANAPEVAGPEQRPLGSPVQLEQPPSFAPGPATEML